MFSKAKVGDRVWSFLRGWGTIAGDVRHPLYSINVRFDNGNHDDYTEEGKRFPQDKQPELYWDEIKFEIPKRPKRKVKKELNLFLNIYPKHKIDSSIEMNDWALVIHSTLLKSQIGVFDEAVIVKSVPATLTFEIEE